MMTSMPPGLLLVFGAFAVPFLSGRARAAWVLVLPLVVLAWVWALPSGPLLGFTYLDFRITPVETTALGQLFATIFAIMAFTGALFGLNQDKTVEIVASLAYAGSAIGVTLAGDMITVFVFWEIMAIASTLMVWSAETPESYRASMRYLIVHLMGGVILMTGIIAHVANTGSIGFEAMKLDGYATWAILAGFLINAGAPPLSAWLPDAYPEASWSGMTVLSAFTTKTAVYVLIRGFPGAEILIYIGLYMVFYGIIYALLENDMRRILAYSIINQVGFMVTGVGIGTEMALNGAASHAFTHIIYKALLLMSAGSVLYMTGKRKCTELGGLFQSMPITAICGVIGALAISSFPLTSGFVSKSMISQAAADETMVWVWFLLAAASAGVFLHAGIKFPWFVFFQKDSGLRSPDPPWNMRAAMILFAALCIMIGIAPGPLYAMLPFPVDYVPYTGAHVLNMLQLLMFSGLAFFLVLPVMKRKLTMTLDVDWFYRKLAPAVTIVLAGFVSAALRLSSQVARQGLKGLANFFYRQAGPEGALARTHLPGRMVLWVVLVLTTYLVLYLI